MWALAEEDKVRHDFGIQRIYPHIYSDPIAICGHKGKYPIDYNAVRTPKCQQCLLLWPTYGKKKEGRKCGEGSEK